MNKYLGEDILKLGFGLMRLPTIGETIDLEQTKKMVDTSIEKERSESESMKRNYHKNKRIGR